MSNRKSSITIKASAALRVCRCCVVALVAAFALVIVGCERAPLLHLHEPGGNVDVDVPVVEVELDVFWDYELNFGIAYDWRAEWYYGWDNLDKELFGELGYEQPDVFHLRRYHTGNEPYVPHTSVLSHVVKGSHFSSRFDWGYWDILAWSDIKTLDGIQSIVFDETTTLDSVWASTNQTMLPARYQAPRFTRSFYQPEALFAGYTQAEHISPTLEGFVWDEERQAWVKSTNMLLLPVTYIYLTQVILHNNNGRVDNVDGDANLSGMARSVNLNTGIAGSDPITTHYNVRFKKGCDMNGERVDIAGGRLLTFGMCGVNGSRVTPPELRADGEEHRVDDGNRHYMDIQMLFNNGMDSTFVFDVTDQVQRRYKGGVITVELDMDTVRIPSRSGGSGFDAVVVSPDSVTYEFEM